MLEIIVIAIVVIVSILIGYGMGHNSSPAPTTYVQNVYEPESVDAGEIYRQTKSLLDNPGEKGRNT